MIEVYAVFVTKEYLRKRTKTVTGNSDERRTVVERITREFHATLAYK